jgi:hypothetical protein
MSATSNSHLIRTLKVSSSRNAVAAAAASRSSLPTSGPFAPAAASLAHCTAAEASARKVDLHG